MLPALLALAGALGVVLIGGSMVLHQHPPQQLLESGRKRKMPTYYIEEEDYLPARSPYKSLPPRNTNKRLPPPGRVEVTGSLREVPQQKSSRIRVSSVPIPQAAKTRERVYPTTPASQQSTKMVFPTSLDFFLLTRVHVPDGVDSFVWPSWVAFIWCFALFATLAFGCLMAYYYLLGK